MNDVVMFDPNKQQNLPAHLQGANLGVSAGLLATAGAGGNRIGLKGSRFRIVLSGQEESVVEENYLDVILVGAVPHISRMYYEGPYNKDDKIAPTCFSVDGVAPPLDLETRQSDKCDTCQWNVKGSKIVDGNKTRACSFFQRVVVKLANDDSDNYYRLDVKALGLFGDSIEAQNKFNIQDYSKMLSNRGVDAGAIVTRLSFDTDVSVPKLFFSPHRFIDEQEFQAISRAVGSDEVKELLKIDVQSTDVSGETSMEDKQEPKDVPAEEAEEPAAEEPAAEEPAAEEPAAEEPAAEAPTKRKFKMTEKAGEFTYASFIEEGWEPQDLLDEGYMEDVTPKPVPPKPKAKPVPPKPKPKAKPVPPKPKVQKNIPAPEEDVPAKPPSKPAAKAAVTETSTSSELDDIISDLS